MVDCAMTFIIVRMELIIKIYGIQVRSLPMESLNRQNKMNDILWKGDVMMTSWLYRNGKHRPLLSSL